MAPTSFGLAIRHKEFFCFNIYKTMNSDVEENGGGI